jgi:hypothetical protein
MKTRNFLLLGGSVVVLIAAIGTAAGSSNSGDAISIASSNPTSAPPAGAAAQGQGIGEGTYEVGKEIPPGTYKATDDGGFCYWARLKSTDEMDIISNHAGAGPTIVTIKSTDKYFKTNGCTTWKRVN